MCPYEPKHTKGNTKLMGYGNIEKKTLIVCALREEKTFAKKKTIP